MQRKHIWRRICAFALCHTYIARICFHFREIWGFKNILYLLNIGLHRNVNFRFSFNGLRFNLKETLLEWATYYSTVQLSAILLILVETCGSTLSFVAARSIDNGYSVNIIDIDHLRFLKRERDVISGSLLPSNTIISNTFQILSPCNSLTKHFRPNRYGAKSVYT